MVVKRKKKKNRAHVLSFDTVETSTIITNDKKLILSRIRTYIKAKSYIHAYAFFWGHFSNVPKLVFFPLLLHAIISPGSPLTPSPWGFTLFLEKDLF